MQVSLRTMRPYSKQLHDLEFGHLNKEDIANRHMAFDASSSLIFFQMTVTSHVDKGYFDD